MPSLSSGNIEYSRKKSRTKQKAQIGPKHQSCEIMDAEILGGELRLDICLHPVSCASSPKLTQRVWARMQCFLYPWQRCPLGWESITASSSVWPVMSALHSPFESLCFKNSSGCWKKMDANQIWSEQFFLLSGIYKYFMIILNRGLISSSCSFCLSSHGVSWHFRSFTESENLRPERTLRIGNVWLHADIFLLLSELVLV